MKKSRTFWLVFLFISFSAISQNSEYKFEHLTLKDGLPSKKYSAISKFPTISRDLSILMPKDEPYNKLKSLVMEASPNSLLEVEMFDLYEGERIEKDKKSIAITLTFGSMDKTLTDQEIDKAIEKVISLLKNSGEYQLRV